MATNKIKGVTAPAKVNGILAANISKLLGTVFTVGGVATAALVLNAVTATIAADGSPDADSGTTALTYTGATHKRQWNGDGVLEHAPCNLFTGYSEAPTNWVQQQSTIAVYVGSDRPFTNATSAISVKDGNSGLNTFAFAKATYTVPTDYNVKCVVWARNVNRGLRAADWVMIQTRFFTTGNLYSMVHLSGAGSVGTQDDLGVTVTQQTGDHSDWYKIEWDWASAGIADALGEINVWLSGGGGVNDFNFDHDGTAEIAFVGPHIYPEVGAADYMRAEGSAVYGARAGTNCRKPVTNEVHYPEQLDEYTAGFVTLNASFSGGQTDPFGGRNAFDLLETTATGQHRFAVQEDNHGPIQSVDTNRIVTASVYFRPNGRSYIACAVSLNSLFRFAYFNGSNFTKGTIPSQYLDSGIVEVPGSGGWCRVWCTFEWTTSNTDRQIYWVIADANDSFSYTGVAATGVTFFGPNVTEGGIQDYIGAANLLSADKAFTDAAWTKVSTTATDGDLAPDGSTDADSIDCSTTGNLSRYIERSVTLSSETYNLSFFARAKELDFFRVYANVNGTVARAYFDLTNGTTGTVQAGIDSTKLQYIGSGVYRCSIVWTENTGGSRPLGFGIGNADNTTFFSGTAGDGMAVWGAQLTKGATLYPYVGMPQTAFIQQGYQSEADATNLCQSSNDLTDAGVWTENAGVDVTANQSLDMGGELTLDKLELNTGSGNPRTIHHAANLTSGTVYCSSAAVRMADYRYFSIKAYTDENDWCIAVFDTLTGEVTKTENGAGFGDLKDSGAIRLANGLFRFWIAYDPEQSDATAAIVFGIHNTGTPTLNTFGSQGWNGTAGAGLYLGNIQTEVGSYPSSFIATFGGTDDRDADDLTDATMSWHNDTVISAIIDAVIGGGVGSADKVLMEINTTGSNSDVYVNTSSQMQSRDGGTNITGFTDTVAANGRYKVASKWAANDQGVSMNGSVADTNTSANHYGATQTALEIGRRSTGDNLNGFVRTIEIWDTDRSDAELATDSLITDDGTRWVDEQLAA